MTNNKNEQNEIINVFRNLKLETEADREYFAQLSILGQEPHEEDNGKTTYIVTRCNTKSEEDDA